MKMKRSKITKWFYLAFGFLSLGLGTVGIFLPVLPTTPFYLLTAFCFSRGSKRWDRWFRGTKLYKRHLEEFITTRAMTWKSKILIFAFAATMMTISAVMVNKLPMTIAIACLLLFQLYYFIFRIKTIRSIAKRNGQIEIDGQIDG